MENCIYFKQNKEYNKSVKELTKLYEDSKKKYDLLSVPF